MYPFVINLQPYGELPSSFEGRKGYVRYTLQGQIARPWKPAETLLLPFTVINHLDLNTFHDAVVCIKCNQATLLLLWFCHTVIVYDACHFIIHQQMPIMQYRRQEISGCCCSEGEIVVQMKVNKSGFVPGEPIVMEMDINNKSESPVQAWTVELIQVSQMSLLGQSDTISRSSQIPLHGHSVIIAMSVRYHYKVSKIPLQSQTVSQISLQG